MVATLFGRRTDINYYYARFSSYIIPPLLNVELIMEGEEHLRDQVGIIVCNHQSTMDVIPLTLIMPKNSVIIAKKIIRFYPLLGFYMILARTIFLDRARRDKAISTFADAAETVREQQVSVVIFPEGTRGHLKCGLLPFKKGAFHLAQQAQVPIIPVVVSSYDDVYSTTRKSFPGGTIRIRALPPISTKGLTPEDVTDLTDRTRIIMQKTLLEITSDAVKEEAALEAKNGEVGDKVE
ncbi:hypothetical protein BJ684DRAFT_16545 [Piptocephalis cylindrospora]|uniref:1-acyl-sn-glycerol-3-phosphate acyltransferase n=1 Tax=Piptocephalis cylindrospora TaxID=1907219 RepID=A0A4P9Y4F1_9FUNG|nr:hypothetical protein BJ684DRAFT_16545 [Piptocephalis cylindrospora]|eukprot:RKP13021.1 hypothetical protein BJ684DRAFT_16545 [Piptocephalis cylindrospora]